MYYYRARWYDPATGQFISEDPIEFTAGDPNLFRYVGNHPTYAVDPSGLYESPRQPGRASVRDGEAFDAEGNPLPPDENDFSPRDLPPFPLVLDPDALDRAQRALQEAERRAREIADPGTYKRYMEEMRERILNRIKYPRIRIPDRTGRGGIDIENRPEGPVIGISRPFRDESGGISFGGGPGGINLGWNRFVPDPRKGDWRFYGSGSYDYDDDYELWFRLEGRY